MNNDNKPEAPDFIVHLESKSVRSTEDFYCEPSNREVHSHADSASYDVVATLQTDSVYIDVNEVNLAEPSSMTLMPNRVGFTLLVSSSVFIEYGYGPEFDVSRVPETGNILFILPGREIHSRLSPGKMRTVTCTFEKAYAEGFIGPFDRLSQSQLNHALSVQSSLVSAILLRLMKEALHPGAVSSAVAESLGKALLVECVHWLSEDNINPERDKQLTSQDLEFIENYLVRSPGKSQNVAELAATCGFSERCFSKLFREQIGCSIAQYTKVVKIAKAKAFLLETDLSLKEIAYRLGFSTPANFSYSFRAATGLTPGQFRRLK